MANLESYVPRIHAEAERLAQFLEILSAVNLQRQSACDLWQIRDVVAHLIWGATFYTDTVSRGLQGDTSLMDDRPPGDLPDDVPLPTYLAEDAIRRRQALADQLLPTFRASFHALTALLATLDEPAWETPCAFFRPFGGQLPARAFLLLTVQELAIHTWDIRSRFEAGAVLAAPLLPVLLERIPARVRLPGFTDFPLPADRPDAVRYRWHLIGAHARDDDLVVESGQARLETKGNAAADVTLRCDDSAFALLMYKRLTLEAAIAQGRLSVEGAPELMRALDAWLK
jgi:uncharacterized protein (TIGR03083 family)